MCPSVFARARARLLLNALSEPGGFGMPSMPPTCPIATWMPTPVRKPTAPCARGSSRGTRAARRARGRGDRREQRLRAREATHCGDAGWRPEMPSPAMPAYMIAAVAESAPTTRCFDEPKSAKGDRDQDRVEAGDHRHARDLRVAHHLGIASAASVTPARMSCESQSRWYGRIPSRNVTGLWKPRFAEALIGAANQGSSSVRIAPSG
jgi:hypothetical protein